MKNITFGRYTPFNSLIHKLDPRNKLFLSIILVVAIFFKFNLWSTTLIMSGIYLILLIVLMIISRVSFLELFNSLKGMWLLVLFLFAIYIFIPNGDTSGGLAFQIGELKVYWSSFYMTIYIIIRLIIMLGVMMVLTSTTKPMDLTYGFEWFMLPLKKIRFPAHEIAMTLSIALRFIPTLLEETDRIMKAQSSRGVDFNKGGLGKRFKAIFSLIIPLFVSAIERSEELANAMEARGYNPKAKRTRYRVLKFSISDLFSFIFVAIIFACVMVMFVFDNQNPVDIVNLIFNVKGF